MKKSSNTTKIEKMLNIRKAVIIIAMLLPLIELSAQTEPRDTLLDVARPNRLTIMENTAGTIIEVEGDNGVESVMVEYDSDAIVSTTQQTSHKFFRFPFSNEECYEGDGDHWDVSMDGLCIGLTDAHGLTGADGLQWSKSFEISWLSCLNVNYLFSRSRISLGLGFDWRNYKATADGKWLTATEDRGIDWGVAPEGARVRYSRLKVFSLQVPLFYTWSVPKTSLQFKAGPIACFNTYASLLGVYDDADGNRCEYFTKAIDRRPFTVDFYCSLSFRNAIGVYVRYSPMKVMKTASPLNFTPLTVGIGFLI